VSTQERCGVVYKGRPPCKQRAGAGTDHKGSGPCRFHGGNLATISAHYEIANALKEANRLAPFGSAPETNPEQSLLDLVSQSAALVSFYGGIVEELANEEMPETVSGTFMRSISGYSKGSRLFGPEIAVDKDGSEHIVGEKLRGMVALWNEERDRLAKYSKAALSAGIEKRRIELAEQQGEHIVVVINNVLVKLGMSGETLAQARTMIAAEFRQLGSGEVT